MSGKISVDTKSRDVAIFGNDATGIGFIRVRKRKLKGGHPDSRADRARSGTLTATSQSFDLVKAVRVSGKPRHRFVLGLGSQKDVERDDALCLFWAHAIARMIRHEIAADQRQRLIVEIVRKGARVPSIAQCEQFARDCPHGGLASAINELTERQRDAAPGAGQ
jgi:hypothetical protein